MQKAVITVGDEMFQKIISQPLVYNVLHSLFVSLGLVIVARSTELITTSKKNRGEIHHKTGRGSTLLEQ